MFKSHPGILLWQKVDGCIWIPWKGHGWTKEMNTWGTDGPKALQISCAPWMSQQTIKYPEEKNILDSFFFGDHSQKNLTLETRSWWTHSWWAQPNIDREIQHLRMLGKSHKKSINSENIVRAWIVHFCLNSPSWSCREF